MLVYCTRLWLSHEESVDSVLPVASQWLADRTHQRVTVADLKQGRELRLYGSHHVEPLCALDEYPQMLSIRYMHADHEVSGRRWVTEIGVKRDGEGDEIEVSIQLRVEDASTRVSGRIEQSRPGLVGRIAHRCALAERTPGARIRRLANDDISAFRMYLYSEARQHSIVLVSPFADGHYALDTGHLRDTVLSLGEVVEIDRAADTYLLADQVGQRLSAYRGAINIIHPLRRGRDGKNLLQTRLLVPDTVRDLLADGGARRLQSEILSLLTHRYNVPMARHHLSPADVRRTIERRISARRRAQVLASGRQDEMLAYFEEEVTRLERVEQSLNETVLGLEVRIQEQDDELRSLRYQLDCERVRAQSLERQAHNAALQADEVPILGSMEELGDYINDHLSDRIIVTGAAMRSMKDSPYRNTQLALECIQVLANEFRAAYAEGRRMEGAIESLSRLRVEFKPRMSPSTMGRFSDYERSYKGRRADMNKHLCLGSSFDPEESCRIHFDWDAEEGKIVIHHAGRHLDTVRS